MSPPDPDNNPLLSGSPRAWDDLIESIQPASLLVLIESRMSERLRARYTAEDVLQESLLMAWRDRHRCVWKGTRAFRAWLVAIIENRIRDLADFESAQKRGGVGGVTGAGTGDSVELPSNLAAAPATAGATHDGARPAAREPARSTTPSRSASHREQAAAMRRALADLPDDVRDVVRLRLFEKHSIEEIAGELKIGESAVRHRFRRGAALYQLRLMSVMGSQSIAITGALAAYHSPANSSDP